MPNHLRGLVFWNFELIGKPTFTRFYDISKRNNAHIVNPRFYGLHGPFAADFKTVDGIFINPGKKMSVDSIYEYQLQKRLGYVPSWLNALK